MRTRDDTAISPKDYKEVVTEIKFGKRDTEKKVKIPIIDDEEWNPDLEFYVELFNPNLTERGVNDLL